MKVPELAVKTLDYRQVNAANFLLPAPSVISSSRWQDLHFELFQQLPFETAEHHTMHVIACGIPHPQTEKRIDYFSKERWLDGKLKTERRNIGDIATIPADISYRCNWNTSVQFIVLAIEPVLLKQVGIDWVNCDRTQSRISLLH